MIPTEAERSQPAIALDGLKVAQVLPLDSLPAKLAAPDNEPQADVTLDLVLAGISTAIPARIGGRNFRRTVRGLSQRTSDEFVLLFNGKFVTTPKPGEFALIRAGLSVQAKTLRHDKNNN